MFSRRSFIAASLSLLIAPYEALAKKAPKLPILIGPHTLAKEEWPPAIQPDFLTVVDKGYALLGDQAGTFAIVNFKREEGPQVIGELVGVGKKVVDLTVTPHRAYAIAYQEVQGEPQNSLVTLSIVPANDPSILSRTPLSYFSDPTTVAAGNDVVVVGGVSLGGQNQVLLFSVSPKRRPDEGSGPVATLGFGSSVIKLDYQDRQLCVVQSSGSVTEIDVFNLSNLQNPQKIAGLRFDGNYHVFARNHDVVAVAGQGKDHKFDVKLISMKPTPRVVSQLTIPVSEVLDLALQKGQLLVLCNQINRQAVVPITYDKTLSMTASDPVLLPAGTRGAASKARIAASGKEAYVASDWGGVQVLNISKTGWQYTYSHTIPRLPAAAAAVSADRAVLGGADLKVYNIAQPQHPVLADTVDLGSAVRAVQVIGTSILALTRDTLSLRALDKPSNTVASVKVSGQSLTYDNYTGTAYVLSPKQNTSLLYPVKVNGTIVLDKPIELQGLYQHAASHTGKLLVAGLNNLSLYSFSESPQPIASRTFPNLAIRDVAFTDGVAVITALDASSKGFLLLIDTNSKDLNTIGSVDLGQDCVALAVSGKAAVVVGRSPVGKDVASIVDLRNPAAPKVTDSFPVLDHASAVVIRDRMAVVAGRGLELLNL